jgi:hypothetical protein
MIGESSGAVRDVLRGTAIDDGQFSGALPHHFLGHRADADGIFIEDTCFNGFVFIGW